MFMVIGFFVAVVDRLYWAVFKNIIIRSDIVPPKGPGGPVGPLFEALICGIAGVAAAFVLGRQMGHSDLFTFVVGAFVGGRILGGAIDLATVARR
jgi:hypothetical protein